MPAPGPAAIHAICRVALALIWIYQGLVPKLLAPHTGEIEIARAAGTPAEHAPLLVTLSGWAEILFGVALLVFWKRSVPLWISLASVPVLAIVGLVSKPGLYLLPFNPASLLVAMAALAAIGLIARPPSADR